jgi:hypothetical protein
MNGAGHLNGASHHDGGEKWAAVDGVIKDMK